MSTQAMVDAICEAVLRGCAGGESRVHVGINREINRPDGLVSTDFIMVEGFACGDPTCDRAYHVRVLSASPVYEYPDHLEHREEET